MNTEIVKEKIKTIRKCMQTGNFKTGDFLLTDLETYLLEKEKNFDVNDVFNTVSAVTGLNISQIKSPSRMQLNVVARCIIVKILIDDLKFTLVRCGMLLGGRDHSTVISAQRRWRNVYQHNKYYQSLYNQCVSQILEK